MIQSVGGDNSPVIWMMLKTREGDPWRIREYRTFFENEVRPILERVRGVGSLFVFGGSEQRLEVVVDPQKLAQRQITLGQTIARLRDANHNTSAGLLGISKRNYRVRTVGTFQNQNDPLDVVLMDDGVHRVFLRDVADARFGYEPNPAPVMHNGSPMIVVGVRKEAGTNVLAMTQRMREAVERAQRDLLDDKGLYIHWAYDQTQYINTAIGNVQKNLTLGGLLAITVLLVFLRSITSTLTVALTIPICVVSTFIALAAFGRNINVVSLAGISFAVGMLVDNAIVVL